MRTKLIVLLYCFILFSCKSDEFDCGYSQPDRNEESVTIHQGLWGDIWFWQGDFMPGCPSGSITPVERTVYVYELTTEDEAVQTPGGFFSTIGTALVATVTSNSNGFFEVPLDPGTYSIFIQEGDLYYANRWTSEGINPVTITEEEITELRIDITYEADY